MQYVPDILAKRGPHREGHLKAAQHQVRHEYTCDLCQALLLCP